MIYSKFYSASDVRLKEFPAVQWLRLCTLTAEVQSLVRKLRSHKPHGAAKKKKKVRYHIVITNTVMFNVPGHLFVNNSLLY